VLVFDKKIFQQRYRFINYRNRKKRTLGEQNEKKKRFKETTEATTTAKINNLYPQK
jgi:hypothetical protein